MQLNQSSSDHLFKETLKAPLSSSGFSGISKLPQRVNFPLVMAPMVGLSHVAFRLLLRSYLPKEAVTFWPTEMLNSRKIPRQNLQEHPMSLRGESESELCPQILGNEEGPIRDSLRCLMDWGAEGVDINMGCPVAKALRHNYGVSLMGDIDYARQVVEMTVKNARVPVSVKLRAGLQKDEAYLKTFVKAMEEAGASWIALHPRLASQKRRGKADWQQIKIVKEILSIPVIGNGDVQTREDLEAMLGQTGCNMVMVGRALTARPWLFWQVGEWLGFGSPEGRQGQSLPLTGEEEASEYGRSLLMLIDLLENYYEDRPGLVRFKYHVKVGHVWLNYGHSLVSKLVNIKTYEQAREIVAHFFTSPYLSMSKKTNLRE